MRHFLLSISLLGLLGLTGCKYTAGVCDCQYRDECHLKAPWVYRSVSPPVQQAGYLNPQSGPVMVEERGGPAVRDR